MNKHTEALQRRRLLTGRYLTLLMALLSVAVLEPLLSQPWVLNVFFTLVLLSAVWALSRYRWQWVAALALAFPNLLVKWTLWLFAESTSFVVTTTTLDTIHGLLNLTFLAFVALMMLGHVMHSRQVTSDTICGAICVYVLMGLAWAEAYTVVELRSPGSFHHSVSVEDDPSAVSQDPFVEDPPSRPATGAAASQPSAAAETTDEVKSLIDSDPSHNFGSYVYYSFTTITTLGYGDITPVSRTARTLAWLEAVTGQLFLAVLIARLVGLHIVHEEQRAQIRHDREKAAGLPPDDDDIEDDVEDDIDDSSDDEEEDS